MPVRRAPFSAPALRISPGSNAVPANWSECERYLKATSALGWPEQRVTGHLVRWYGASKGVGAATAFVGFDAQTAKNAMDDAESRVEIVNKITDGRKIDPDFYAVVGEPLKFANSLSDPADLTEMWFEVSAKLNALQAQDR